jgi:hypothetical protein
MPLRDLQSIPAAGQVGCLRGEFRIVSNAREQSANGATASAGVLPPEEDVDAMLLEARAVDALLQRIARISFAPSPAVESCVTPLLEAATAAATKVAPAFGADDPSP